MGWNNRSETINILAVVSILISLSIFFFRENITLFPSFIHAWTQSDRYALTFGFLNNHFDFFHPQTFNLITIDGITRVDFPVHEYIIALIMHFTGIHEPVVFRIYTLVYAITGSVFLYRLSRLLEISFFKSVFVVLFMFFSPVFLYYADGFLPSIPSLSNLFIGYFFYFRYKKDSSKSDFYRSVFFITLAALARLPYFIFLLAICLQQVLDYLLKRKINRKELIAMSLSLLVWTGYQVYNAWLGSKYGSQFLTSLLPPRNLAQLKIWIHDTWATWHLEYFTLPHYVTLAILILATFLLKRTNKNQIKNFREIIIHFAIAGFGCLLFFLMMLMQFPDHDYYFLDSFYPLAALLVIFLMGYAIQHRLLNISFSLVLLALLALSFVSGNQTYRKRFETGFWDRTEITRNNFQESGKFLDSIGVPKNARVLVLDGYTTNVPLLLMNRKGWTVNWTTRQNIEEGLSKPYDLVAIQNAFVASEIVRNDSNVLTRLVRFADNGKISFYQKKIDGNPETGNFFGIDSLHSKIITGFPDSGFVDERSEFLTLFEDSSQVFRQNFPVKILLTGKIKSQQSAPGLVASSPDNYYFSFDLNDYTQRNGEWENMLFQFVIPPVRNGAGPVKVYFWNKQKSNFSYRDLKIICYW